MYAGGATCSKVAVHLGTGTSTVNNAVKEVSKCIRDHLFHNIQFPSTRVAAMQTTNGLTGFANLPQCDDAVDGTQIHWLKSPPN